MYVYIVMNSLLRCAIVWCEGTQDLCEKGWGRDRMGKGSYVINYVMYPCPLGSFQQGKVMASETYGNFPGEPLY